MVCRLLLQCREGFLCLGSLPGHGVGMSERPGHFRLASGQRESLMKLRDGVLVSRLLLVRPPKVHMRLREVRVHLETLSEFSDGPVVLTRIIKTSYHNAVDNVL